VARTGRPTALYASVTLRKITPLCRCDGDRSKTSAFGLNRAVCRARALTTGGFARLRRELVSLDRNDRFGQFADQRVVLHDDVGHPQTFGVVRPSAPAGLSAFGNPQLLPEGAVAHFAYLDLEAAQGSSLFPPDVAGMLVDLHAEKWD
jgi:hypothetical protein